MATQWFSEFLCCINLTLLPSRTLSYAIISFYLIFLSLVSFPPLYPKYVTMTHRLMMPTLSLTQNYAPSCLLNPIPNNILLPHPLYLPLHSVCLAWCMPLFFIQSTKAESRSSSYMPPSLHQPSQFRFPRLHHHKHFSTSPQPTRLSLITTVTSLDIHCLWLQLCSNSSSIYAQALSKM